MQPRSTTTTTSGAPKSGVPYAELYRPQRFEDIVLDEWNRRLLTNVVATGTFPHLLLYGPPGTGKTTTVIALIHAYQLRHYGSKQKEHVMHLNASHERGIDIIRTQISTFVHATPLFRTGMKFVVLDEVDYITKNAQQALRQLLQHATTRRLPVRFCLICNYVSKLDRELRRQFTQLRFNRLPPDAVVAYLAHIAKSEDLAVSEAELRKLQRVFRSDMRSMINKLQYNATRPECDVPDDDVWQQLAAQLTEARNDVAIDHVAKELCDLSQQYNLDVKHVLRGFVHYVLRAHPVCLTSKFLTFVERMFHANVDYTLCHCRHIARELADVFRHQQQPGPTDPMTATI